MVEYMRFEIKSFVLLIVILLLFGCLSPWQKLVPLNETGFIPPPIYNEPRQNAMPNLAGNEIGTNMPLICTLDEIINGQNITIYMLGTSARSEYFNPKTNATTITIIKGGNYYMNEMGVVTNNTAFENCSWFVFNKTSTNNNNATKDFYNINTLGAMKVSNLPNCKIGTFGNEIFEINGTICDFGKILEQNIINASKKF